MGIFDKKTCSICGGEIGLLGNRKLEDGNLCKECARKLSPFFLERRHSTVEDIKAHLAYREENAKALQSFNPTLTFGEGRTKVMIDSAKQQFIVTSSSKWQEANPDIINISQLKDCKYEIEEEKEEIFDKDEKGEEISFDPPKYDASYTFEIEMDVDSPYFSEIEFEFSDEEPKSTEDELYKKLLRGCRELQHALMPSIYGDPALEPELSSQGGGVELVPQEVTEEGEWKCPKCGKINNENFCTTCGEPRPGKWFCGKCGKENYGNFCSACGNPAPADQIITR